MLSLDVTPGVVTAVFFVVFDIFVLAFVDIVTTNIVCALYYRDIVAGIPIDIRSVDVLGLTSYLVGRRFAVANIVGLLIKLSFVTMVFFANLNIESELLPPDTSDTRNATFDFKTTESTLDLRVPLVYRSMSVEQSCREVGDNNATFFRIIFNARERPVDTSPSATDTVALEPIDENTYVCLSPGSVLDPVPIFNVTGCSSLTKNGCSGDTMYNRTVKLNKFKQNQFKWQLLGTTQFGFPNYEYDRAQMQEAFEEYTKPELKCVEVCASSKRCCAAPEQTSCTRTDQKCMLFSFNGTHTLMERWRLTRLNDEDVLLTRLYPGPVMLGEIFLNMRQTEAILLNTDTSRSWLELATNIYREGLVYDSRTTRFRELKKRTRIPAVSIVLGIAMLLIVAITSVVVAVTIGRDQRPRFNTIDGLSSIAREEKAPSMNSFRKGAPVFLALTPRQGNTLHFGPVERVDHGVPRNGRWVQGGYHRQGCDEDLEEDMM